MLRGLQSPTEQEGYSFASDPSGNSLHPEGWPALHCSGWQSVASPGSAECLPPWGNEPSAMTVSLLSPPFYLSAWHMVGSKEMSKWMRFDFNTHFSLLPTFVFVPIFSPLLSLVKHMIMIFVVVHSFFHWEREKHQFLLFCLFMHPLADSCMCPDRGSNPQPWQMRTSL